MSFWVCQRQEWLWTHSWKGQSRRFRPWVSLTAQRGQMSCATCGRVHRRPVTWPLLLLGKTVPQLAIGIYCSGFEFSNTWWVRLYEAAPKWPKGLEASKYIALYLGLRRTLRAVRQSVTDLLFMRWGFACVP